MPHRKKFLLSDLNQEGRTIVLITHEADVAERAGRTVMIHDGSVWPSDADLVTAGGVS